MKKHVIRFVIMGTVFLPFLLFGLAMSVIPNPIHLMGMTTGWEYMWLIMFGAMTLGLLYWLFYIEDEGEVALDFEALDTMHYGYITREMVCRTNGWEHLCKVFDLIDTDRDGKISRQEFGTFEKSDHSLLNHLGHI